jgi:signal peptidase I
MKCLNVFGSKLLWGVVIGLCCGLWLISSLFEFFEMGSTSMEPYIIGQGNPPTHRGDEVLILKRFYQPLHLGDLVLLTIGGSDPTPTIRRVAGISGDAVPDPEQTDSTVVKVPDGYYFLLGGTTNALDSRQLGLFSSAQISGKVIWVKHSSR